MVRIAAFILDSQMTTSDPTMLVCLSIRSSPVIKFKSFYFFAFFLWFQLLPKDIFKKFLYDLRRPLLHIPSGAGVGYRVNADLVCPMIPDRVFTPTPDANA